VVLGLAFGCAGSSNEPWNTGCSNLAISTAHKRQISQAIPSNERPNAPDEEQEDPEAEAQGEGSEGTRKSARIRKPKRN